MPKEKNDPKTDTITRNATRPEFLQAVQIAVTNLFESGDLEIPDDCVAGVVSARIGQLEARITSQGNRIVELQAKVDGKPGVTTRVDALEKSAKK